MSFPNILFSLEFSALFLLITFSLLKCSYSWAIIFSFFYPWLFSSSLIDSSPIAEAHGTFGLHHPLDSHPFQGFINYPCADSFLVSEYSFLLRTYCMAVTVLSSNLFLGGEGVRYKCFSSVVFFIFLSRNLAIIPSSKVLNLYHFWEILSFPLVSPFCQ